MEIIVKDIYTSYVCQDKKINRNCFDERYFIKMMKIKSIEEIMKEDFQYVYTHTDQEEVC